MLQLKIELEELFNEATDEFEMATVTVELEHSLLSLSKWEAKYEKPFLSPDDKSPEEILDYVTFMVVTPNFDYNLLDRLSTSNFDEINKYISSKQSATWFAEDNSPPSREVITAELIYYWMFSMQIPKECEEWHLNRLFTLIRVFNAKNNPKKMSPEEIARRNRELNAKRLREMNTKG
mgnify:FL=1